MNKTKLAIGLMIVLSFVICVSLALRPPMAQFLGYHNFSDRQTIFGVPNFWNVISNMLFLIVGAIGLYKLHIGKTLQVIDEIKGAYTLLFIGVALVSAGSGYYHLAPDNHTLVWDRLPMTIAFMALFSIIISEYISLSWGKLLLLPLIAIGIFSVVYWNMTELRGQGDLRLYALVQFLPMLLIPIILLCFNPVYTNGSGYWYLLMAYVAAKLLEHFDAPIYETLGFMGGHPLKHVAASIGIYCLIYAYERRSVRKATTIDPL